MILSVQGPDVHIAVMRHHEPKGTRHLRIAQKNCLLRKLIGPFVAVVVGPLESLRCVHCWHVLLMYKPRLHDAILRKWTKSRNPLKKCCLSVGGDSASALATTFSESTSNHAAYLKMLVSIHACLRMYTNPYREKAIGLWIGTKLHYHLIARSTFPFNWKRPSHKVRLSPVAFVVR